MTGMVTLPAASVGEAGEALLRMEAMKMELSLRAPCSGEIAGIFTSERASVGGGAVLTGIMPDAR